jgi:hypothetical protein
MKTSFHSLTHYLPLLCNCQFRRLDSIQFLSPETHVVAGWRLETRLFCMLLVPASELFFITTLHGPRRKHSLCIVEGVFTALLHSNGSYPIVACVFVAAGMCLPSRCLAMNDYSDFAIPAFGRHVTIYLLGE